MTSLSNLENAAKESGIDSKQLLDNSILFIEHKRPILEGSFDILLFNRPSSLNLVSS
jgi:hypothetical protein